MPEKRTGLGRGLDAIFRDNASETVQENAGQKPIIVRLSEIEPAPDQPRKDFDEEALQSLADSILEVGLINPIVVRRGSDGMYQIIAGERRWRACKKAGLSEAPVIIMHTDDLKAAEIALIENLQREDLNEIEKANGYKALIDKFGMTQEELSERIKTSRPAISNSLRLLDLPSKVLEMIRLGKLSAGHGRAILGLKKKNAMERVAITVSEKELSVRDTEKLVKRINSEKPRSESDTEKVVVNYNEELENELTRMLGRKVTLLNGKGRKVKSVCIEYTDNDDLETLIDILKKGTK